MGMHFCLIFKRRVQHTLHHYVPAGLWKEQSCQVLCPAGHRSLDHTSQRLTQGWRWNWTGGVPEVEEIYQLGLSNPECSQGRGCEGFCCCWWCSVVTLEHCRQEVYTFNNQVMHMGTVQSYVEVKIFSEFSAFNTDSTFSDYQNE